MRNKFKILLPDGAKYKPPEKTMVVMNTDGVVFLVQDCNYSGWYLWRLSDTINAYTDGEQLMDYIFKVYDPKSDTTTINRYDVFYCNIEK